VLTGTGKMSNGVSSYILLPTPATMVAVFLMQNGEQ
jgi:hypothetical protein